METSLIARALGLWKVRHISIALAAAAAAPHIITRFRERWLRLYYNAGGFRVGLSSV